MNVKLILMIAATSSLLLACEKDQVKTDDEITKTDEVNTLKSANPANKGFVHGIKVDIEGKSYYFSGAPDGPNGENDVPGHYWVQAGPDKVIGKHYNTGPFGKPNWWSSDAENGEYLYFVDGIIDEWTMMKAKAYAKKGYVHYHEFVSVDDGHLHPEKVIWLKHIAVTSFTLDGGPGGENPPYEHKVTPGLDFQFPNNYMNPYEPDGGHVD